MIIEFIKTTVNSGHERLSCCHGLEIFFSKIKMSKFIQH